jgi:hypothetical protein
VTVKVPDGVKGEELRYLLEAVNAHGAALFRLGSVAEPLVIRVRGAAAVAAASDPILDAGGGSAGSDPPGKPETSPIATPPPKVGEGDPEAAIAATDEAQSKEKEEKPRAWYQTWWFWTGVGVLTAGAVTGAVLATQSGGGSGTLRYDVVLQ